MNSNKPKAEIIIQDTHNIKTMGIGDISFYPSTYTPINPTLEVTPPSFPKVTIPVSARNFILLNSNDLKITCVDEPCQLTELPDGIWKIKYSFAPANENFSEVSFLRTYKLENKLETAFLKTDISECDSGIKSQDMEKIDEIWYYLQEAIASANKCNEKRAIELYRIADRHLTNFLNSKP